MPVAPVTYLDSLDPLERHKLSETQAELRRSIRSPTMPADAAYALLPRLEYPSRPVVYPSLESLARRIHRDRQDDALELVPTSIRFRDRVRSVTEVIAHDAGGRARRIGFAWHAGKHWEVLRAALDEAVPHHAAVEG